jgi:ribosomal RNA-processing protein 36
MLITELASIDFGTLAKAQRTLIQESSATKKSTRPPPKPSKSAPQTKPSSTEPKSKSKNAPQEVSSKRPVSRKHFLPSVQNRHHARDPRFETLSTTESSRSFRKAYDFLDSYQRDEITLLKSQIRQSRDPSERERLQKALQSLTSRRDAKIAKDRANEVLRKKKEEELEKIKHGKQPFYLKKSMLCLMGWVANCRREEEIGYGGEV